MSEKTKATPEERLALMGLNAVYETMCKHIGPLKGRMKHDKYAVRGLMSAKTSLGRAIDAVVETLDKDAADYVMRNSRGHEIIVRPQRVVRDPLWMYVKADDMETVLEAAMQSVCALCMLEGKEIKGCALHKAMVNLIEESDGGFGCGYRGGLKRKDGKER